MKKQEKKERAGEKACPSSLLLYRTRRKRARAAFAEWRRFTKQAEKERDGALCVLISKIIPTAEEARRRFDELPEKCGCLALSLCDAILKERNGESAEERCFAVLQRNQAGEGYDTPLLTHLKSALLLLAFLQYEKPFTKEGCYSLQNTFALILRIEEEKLIRCFSAAFRILEREKADALRLCDGRTVSKYLAVISRQSEKSGLTEEETARRLVAAADRKNIHTGEILLRLNRNEAAGKVYFVSLFSFSFLLLTLLGFLLPLSPAAALLCLALSAFPVYEAVKLFLRRFFAGEDNGFLPSVEPKTAAEKARVLVVIPSLLLGGEHDEALFNRLEDHRLTNREPNFSFAVLGDFASSGKKHEKKDGVFIAYAEHRIRSLNEKYGHCFYLLTRERRYCRSERLYILNSHKISTYKIKSKAKRRKNITNRFSGRIDDLRF